jgi:hypothetical protein
MRKALREPISRPVWMILLSWGLAVLIISGLLSAWIWTNQRESERRNAQLQLEQDRAMCAMIEVFLQGPEPPAGPGGDRSREVRTAMAGYRDVIRCDEIQANPGPAREPRD